MLWQHLLLLTWFCVSNVMCCGDACGAQLFSLALQRPIEHILQLSGHMLLHMAYCIQAGDAGSM
jgi:hypothetical protein